MQCDPSLDCHGNISECGWVPRYCVCLCVLLYIYPYESCLSFKTFIVWAFFASWGHSGSSRLLEKAVRGQEWSLELRLHLELSLFLRVKTGMRTCECAHEDKQQIQGCVYLCVCRLLCTVREGWCTFSLITDIAINSHSAALKLLWQPTPMGYAIKVAPFLYSCIL